MRVERVEERLRRRDPVAVGCDVVAHRAPVSGRAHPLPDAIQECRSLDVDDVEVARRRVAVDRQVEPVRGAS